MRSIGSYAAEVLPPGSPVPPLGPPPPTDSKLPLMHDTCGCLKEAGCCGRDGLHFRPFGRRDVEREISRALAGLPMGTDDNGRRQVKEAARQFAERYIGLQVAYEHCPAYLAAAKQAADQRKVLRGGWDDDL